MAGDFNPLDEWLAAVGYDPLKLAGIPCSGSEKFDVQNAQEGLLDPLYNVQKPERMAVFVNSFSSVSQPDGLGSLAEKRATNQKNKNKMPEGRNEPRHSHSVAYEQVAPPAIEVCREGRVGLGEVGTSCAAPQSGDSAASVALQSSADVALKEKEREQEPESQTTRTKKEPEGSNEPRPYFQAVGSSQVAPFAGKGHDDSRSTPRSRF